MPKCLRPHFAAQEAASCEAFSCGATDYVQKPFSSAVLRHRLRIAAEVQGELRRARAGPPGEGPASAALAARKEPVVAAAGRLQRLGLDFEFGAGGTKILVSEP